MTRSEMASYVASRPYDKPLQAIWERMEKLEADAEAINVRWKSWIIQQGGKAADLVVMAEQMRAQASAALDERQQEGGG